MIEGNCASAPTCLHEEHAEQSDGRYGRRRAGRWEPCPAGHPLAAVFNRLTAAQIDALCNVAFGQYGAGCNKRTLAKLEAKGLIERYDEQFSDRFGTFTIHKWFMPLAVHVDLCAWCAQYQPVP